MKIDKFDDDEEFEFGVNEAAIYFEDGNLVVAFGDGRIATMEIEREAGS